MPGRQQIPSFQLASGTTDERDGSYNLNTLGSVFYNTDTSNVEVYHEDPSNTLGWRDLVMNNKEQIDISGVNKITFSDGTSQTTAVSHTGYENEFGGSFSYAVSDGNPTLASNAQGNDCGGRMDDSLNADIVIPTGHSGKVLVTFNVSGEWSGSAWDKGVILGRATLQADGTTFTYDKLIRATPTSTSGLVISNFLVSYHGNDDSTLEQSSGAIMDDTITAGNTYRYTPILVNTNASNSRTFKLNQTFNSSTSIVFERACSSVIAQLVNISP